MKLAAAALLVLLAACGGDDEEIVCETQHLIVSCCQPTSGDAVCFVSGKDSSCRNTVIEQVSWMGACP